MKPGTQNIAVSKDTHKLLVAYVEKIEGKISKVADRAIREFIEKTEPKVKKPS